MTTLVLPSTSAGIQQAAELILDHQPVAFPTETVYGLGAGVFDLEGIARIYQLKGRPSDNPLIVHICSVEQVALLARDIPDSFYSLASTFFPGPLTVILPKQPAVPDQVTAGQNTVAIRMPAHQIALDLIKAVGQPLVAPSANVSGRPSPTTPAHVLDDLDTKVAAVIDGSATEYGIESTVIDLTQDPPVILRPGTISASELEAVLESPVRLTTDLDTEVTLAPGMKYRHYAPEARIQLFYTPQEILNSHLPTTTTLVLSDTPAPELTSAGYIAHSLHPTSLFAEFRQADKDGFQTIAVLVTPETLQNLGLMNRLQKAATGS